MAYQSSVTSSISLATTTVTSANLGATLFVTANSYFSDRMTSYSSFTEVKEDDSIPSDSNAYTALKLFFSASGAATPVYLGRRAVDTTILTPSTSKIGTAATYTMTVSTGDNSVTASYTSSTTDDAEAIVTDLQASIAAATTVEVTSSVSGTGDDATLEVVKSGTTDFVITSVSNLPQTFETTEDAATLFAALQEENNEDWYFIACEDHTDTFVKAMASEVEATDSDDYPKLYVFSTADAESVVTLPDPAIDLLGELAELGYNRTAGEWSDTADSTFQEVFAVAKMGQYIAGTSTWKFITPNGVDAAADLTTGKNLTTAKQGYIDDRNGSWYGYERGTNFRHGGKVASGEWVDVIRARDYINDTIETNLLALELNQEGGKIPFTTAGKQSVANVIDGILEDCVDLGILSGYVATTVPDSVSFDDKAARILQDVEWTGYLAGAIHFIVVSGVLTYEDEELS